MIAAAILALLLGYPPALRPCGDAHGQTCAELAAEVADACEVAAITTGTDAWTLAAIAHAESRYDRNRHGRLGRGMWGINPRGFMHRSASAFCDADPERCLLAQAIMAGAYLAHERKRCGSWDGALRSYGSGRCDGPAKYPRAVRASVAKLRGAM